MNATVKRGSGYTGLSAWRVDNPDAQRFIPGRTVLICPAHEESGAWRAILAGVSAEGDAVVIPLDQHFAELRVRKLKGTRGLCLSMDEPVSADDVSWTDAKALALSVAYAFNLTGIDR